MWQNIKQNIVLAIEQLRPAALLYLLDNSRLAVSDSLNRFRPSPPVRPDFALPVLVTGKYGAPRPVAVMSVALVAAGASGILFFSFHLKNHYQLEPVTYASSFSKPAIARKKVVQPAAPKVLPASKPSRVDIPSVDIDAPLTPTDLAPDGSIAVPDTPYEAGWYDKSPTPGQLGPAIIVGHVDFIKVGIAVFWRLRYVQPGAEIDISRADGSTARFKVQDVEQYSQSDFPDSKVYGNVDYAGIRIITCGGVFDTATGHYSDNTVVYGVLE